ncbi:MAG: hypothetical protein KAR81_05230 [Sulfurimonas sp.]|nr:hypothetical protein [Sulfurimonas sp.]MCK4974633.1 hypothetical protein [Sulfurimonas sp.]
MKNLLFIAIIYFATSSTVFAQSKDEILLGAFHKYGVTACDPFILKNSRLRGNWSFSISKHLEGIDGPSTEVSLVTIYGTKGDTVKIDDSYIQTLKNCFLHSRSTITNLGSCESNIDSNDWNISSEMPNKDYTTYENKYGIEMQAKEITVGDSKVCIKETSVRTRRDYIKKDK